MGYFEYKLLGAIIGPHILLAILVTMELIALKYFGSVLKIFWFCVIWFIPFVGSIYFYRKKENDEINYKKNRTKIRRNLKKKCKVNNAKNKGT